jgi:hypothetical protein
MASGLSSPIPGLRESLRQIEPCLRGWSRKDARDEFLGRPVWKSAKPNGQRIAEDADSVSLGHRVCKCDEELHRKLYFAAPEDRPACSARNRKVVVLMPRRHEAIAVEAGLAIEALRHPNALSRLLGVSDRRGRVGALRPVSLRSGGRGRRREGESRRVPPRAIRSRGRGMRDPLRCREPIA